MSAHSCGERAGEALLWWLHWPLLHGPHRRPARVALTILALLAHPTIQASLVAILVTGVVPEKVVTGPAELVACGAVVVFIAAHTDLQFQVGHVATEMQALPAILRVDHARV